MHSKAHFIYRIKPPPYFRMNPCYPLHINCCCFSELQTTLQLQVSNRWIREMMPRILKSTHTKMHFCQVDLTFPNPSYFSIYISSWQVEYLSPSLKAILAWCGNWLQRNADNGPTLLLYAKTGAKRESLLRQCWDPISLWQLPHR